MFSSGLINTQTQGEKRGTCVKEEKEKKAPDDPRIPPSQKSSAIANFTRQPEYFRLSFDSVCFIAVSYENTCQCTRSFGCGRGLQRGKQFGSGETNVRGQGERKGRRKGERKLRRRRRRRRRRSASDISR